MTCKRGDKYCRKIGCDCYAVKVQSVDLSPEERAKIVAERADVKYGPFASLHEAYGVLAEELYELGEALDVDDSCYAGETTFFLLVAIQRNDMHLALSSVRGIRDAAREFAGNSEPPRIRAEAIDVIAVCDRIIAQWGDAS